MRRSWISTDKEIDGKDIWDDFLAGRKARKDEVLFATRHHGGFSNVGIREDQWKACCVGKRWKLFDVEQDISEHNDLSLQHPELLQGMIAKAETWSQTHTKPAWFDSLMARDKWNDTGMPNCELIFPSEKA
ncbi:MAG: hypothetical protein AB8B55_17640 [Mariniblastus sp.]